MPIYSMNVSPFTSARSVMIGLAQPGEAVSPNPQPLPPKESVVLRNTPGDAVSLNPQPLPPKEFIVSRSLPGDWVTLNPQPLPPKEASLLRPGDRVSLNPQPLPPKESSLFNPGDWVSLNPQPLPPKESSVFRPGDWVTLNPQPLPPKEGRPTPGGPVERAAYSTIESMIGAMEWSRDPSPAPGNPGGPAEAKRPRAGGVFVR